MSKVELQVSKVKELPVLFGEVDILKTIQLLPGVQGGTEGSNGFFVRGGGSDQNLLVLDEAVVYNASHLFGFFSVFNADAVKSVELYKGGFPAQYGGRLSSVIDVNLREGNTKKYAASGGIGLIASRLTIEGPIKKDTGSFIISGRRTYVDLFTRAVNKANENNEDWNDIPSYYFYDLNGKANYILGKNDRIYASGYFGRDVFTFADPSFNFKFDWGNATTTARWNHSYNPRLFSNLTATFTDYRYRIANTIGGFSFALGSHIQDYTLKADYNYTLSPKHSPPFWCSIYLPHLRYRRFPVQQ